jgi:hypothetical protein
VQADFSIECGAGDECLEMPWASDDGALRHVDLKQDLARIADLEEAQRFPELADFLRAINSPRSAFHTAKCDAGFTHEMTVEDEFFGTNGKFGSYVDVLFTSPVLQCSFEQHEAIARNLVELLHRAPEAPAAMELLVRRCYSSMENAAPEGFYLTCYVFGYSDTEVEARQHWGIALHRVANALTQVSAAIEKEA